MAEEKLEKVEPGTRPIAHPTRVFHTNVENQIIQEV